MKNYGPLVSLKLEKPWNSWVQVDVAYVLYEINRFAVQVEAMEAMKAMCNVQNLPGN